jgi:hypothetical protein
MKDQNKISHHLVNEITELRQQIAELKYLEAEGKQMEVALLSERQRFQTLSGCAPFGLMMIDKENHFRYLNPKFEELFGYDLKDIPDGKTWFKKAYPNAVYRRHVISAWKEDFERFRSGEKKSKIFKVTCRDGTEKIINFMSVRSETGEIWVACEDITECKNAEEKLNETNARLQILQQITASVHSTLDLEKIFRQITDGFVYSMGFTSSFFLKLNEQKTHFEVKALSSKQWVLHQVDKILGFSLRDYSFPVDTKLNDKARRVMNGEVVLTKTAAELCYPLISEETCSILQKLGGIKNYIAVPLQVDRKVVGGVIITSTREEVSEEELKMVKIFAQAASHAICNANLHKQTQQTEEALRRSEDRYRDLVEHSHDLICTHDLEGRILSVNQGVLKIMGYDLGDILNKNVQDTLVPEVRDEFDSYLATIRREGDTSGLVMIQTRSGERRIWEYHNTLRTEGIDQPIVRAMAHDITERLRIERALRRSEEKYRLVAENIKDVICTLDLNLRLTYVSPSVFEALGYTPEECFERKLDKMLSPSSLEVVMEVFAEDMEVEKKKEKDLFRSRILEVELIHKDGSFRWFEVKGNFIHDCSGRPTGVLGILRNVTDRKRDEEELKKYRDHLEEMVEERTQRIQELETQRIEIEKLVASGLMAARIAHEINNPLAGIKNSFLLVKRAIPEDHPYYGYVGRIEREIDRIAQIVRQMFILYRSEQTGKEFPIDKTLYDVIALLEADWRKNNLTVKVDTKPVIMEMPESSLRQVLFNILMNAVDASPEGGIIKIITEVNDGVLTLSVSDQGSGIPFETRSQIFKPFFTTKGGSQNGLGLGLSISKGIVEELGGRINFESKTGKGTVFRISLPIRSEGKAAGHD